MEFAVEAQKLVSISLRGVECITKFKTSINKN